MPEGAKAAGADADEAPEIPVPIGFQKAIVDRGQAQLHPANYVYAFAKTFQDAGGIIMPNCPVDTLEKEGELLEIKTRNSIIKAKSLIWATHTPPGIIFLHFCNGPYRSYAVAVKLTHDSYPIGLAYDMYDPYHYYRTQEIDGVNYLIVGGEDHKTAHEENTAACFNTSVAHVRKYF